VNATSLRVIITSTSLPVSGLPLDDTEWLFDRTDKDALERCV
jgi:hypothetical protein